MQYKINQVGTLIGLPTSPLVVRIERFNSETGEYVLSTYDNSNLPVLVTSELMNKHFVANDSLDLIMKSSEPGKLYYGYAYLTDNEEYPFISNSYQDPIDMNLFSDVERLNEELDAAKMYVGEHKTLRTAVEELINTEMYSTLSENIHAVYSHAEAVILLEKSNLDYIAYVLVKEPQWTLTDVIDDGYKQYVKRVDEMNYEVIEILPLPDDAQEKFIFKFVKVDLDMEMKYPKDVLRCLESYGYDSLQTVRDTYKEGANQIIAECIAEDTHFTHANRFKFLKTEDDAKDLLESYGIEVSA